MYVDEIAHPPYVYNIDQMTIQNPYSDDDTYILKFWTKKKISWKTMPGNEIIEIVTCQQTEFEMIGFELPISLSVFSSV